MSATSIDLSQIKTDALSAASTFRTLIGLGTSDTPTFTSLTTSAYKITIGDMTVGRGGQTSVSRNTAVGYQALYSATLTGNDNTSFGWASCATVTSGANNVAIGASALNANTTGSANVAVGKLALSSNTTASNNTAIGLQALALNQTGTGNTAVGRLALYNTENGSYNTAVGANASGNYATGSYNLAVGYNAQLDSGTDSYQINIGNRYYHNRLRFGDTTPSYDVVLLRDAANTLAMQNGANAQTFRLYRTADGSPGSNYQRLALSSTTYSGAFYQTILCESAGTGGDNINLVLSPKGTGAILAQVPDGTATGGNARGTNAVDLQTQRNDATQVASGPGSVAIGAWNKATDTLSMCFGFGNQATGYSGIAIGYGCTASGASSSLAINRESIASGQYSTAIGTGATASQQYSIALGNQNTSSSVRAFSLGTYSLADRWGVMAYASDRFAVTGDSQIITAVLRIKTTNATATTLMLDGSTTRLTIPSGKVFAFVAKISGIKSDGSAVAFYTRKGAIKNVSGTTSLVGSIETIGTDTEDNASTDVAITADDTNDALQINVTGIAAETWRWVAVVEGVEIGYGT